MILCLLPLNRYMVDYSVATGARFSELDRLTLRAVSEANAITVEKLEDVFCLPPRMLIETVVKLAKFGYLGLSGGTHPVLRVTASGRSLSTSDSLPEATQINDNTTPVFVECMTGGLLLGSQLHYTTSDIMAERGLSEYAYRLSSILDPPSPDQGHLYAVLSSRLRPGNWIHNISAVSSPSKNAYWLPLDVDVERGSIEGIPNLWRRRLHDLVISKAKEIISSSAEVTEGSYWKRSSTTITEPEPVVEETSRWHSVQFVGGDLLLGTGQHVDFLREALTNEADEGCYILIASAFFDTKALDEEVRGWILEGLKRGAHIDLLWGYEAYDDAGTTDGAIDWLKRLKLEAELDNLPGSLRFNEIKTGSHAKLLIYGKGTTFRGCIGSYNWLSTPPSIAKNDNLAISNVSIGTSHPGVVAEICQSAAGLWSNVFDGQFSPNSERWRHIAQQLSKLSMFDDLEEHDTADAEIAADVSTSRVQLIHNQDHNECLRDFLVTVQERSAVVSHKLGSISTIRLAPFERSRGDRIMPLIVQFGLSEIQLAERAELEERLQTFGGVLVEQPYTHAKVAISDDRAIISSYNLLSGQVHSKSFDLREIGMLIEGGWIADKLWSVLQQPSEAAMSNP